MILAETGTDPQLFQYLVVLFLARVVVAFAGGTMFASKRHQAWQLLLGQPNLLPTLSCQRQISNFVRGPPLLRRFIERMRLFRDRYTHMFSPVDIIVRAVRAGDIFLFRRLDNLISLGGTTRIKTNSRNQFFIYRFRACPEGFGLRRFSVLRTVFDESDFLVTGATGACSVC